MSSANKTKGSRFELDVMRYLAEVHGRNVRRPHQAGFKDEGDLHLSPVVLQCKNYADIATALRVGVAGAELQATHAGEPFGAAVLKSRGRPIAEARVAMSLATFRALLALLNRQEFPRA